jgi:uncharacterized protein (TIGR02588 family)
MNMKIEKNWLEWSCFALSLLLICGTISYLAYDALNGAEKPADIEVKLGKPEQLSNYFSVPLTLINHGNETAASVQVEVTMKTGDAIERAELLFDFLPRSGRREGFVTFKSDPRLAQELKGRAIGYTEP